MLLILYEKNYYKLMNKKIAIIGAGGHGKVIGEIAQ